MGNIDASGSMTTIQCLDKCNTDDNDLDGSEIQINNSKGFKHVGYLNGASSKGMNDITLLTEDMFSVFTFPSLNILNDLYSKEDEEIYNSISKTLL